MLSGCQKDKDQATPQYTIDDFVGSWIATSAEFTNNADPGQSFDLVANGGEIRFTMLPGGNTRSWVELGTFSDEWDSKMTMDGNTITSTPAETSRGVSVSTFEYDGTTLILTNTNSSFDFTLSANPEVSATFVVHFVRN